MPQPTRSAVPAASAIAAATPVAGWGAAARRWAAGLLAGALCWTATLAFAAPAPDWDAWRGLLYRQPAQVLRQVEAVSEAGLSAPDALRLALWRQRALAELGRATELVEPLEALRERVQSSDRADLQALWHALYGDALRSRNRVAEAAPHWAQALKLAESVRDFELQSLVHTMRAQAAMDQRDMGAAAAAVEADRLVCDASGDAELLARHLYWAGNLSNELGDHARAIEQFREAAARFEQRGNPTWQSDSLRLWAEALIRAERPAEALRPAEQAVNLLTTLDDEVYLALARASLAEALMAHGRRDEALAMVAKARAGVAQLGSAGTRGGIAVGQAKLLWLAGRPAEAARVLDEVLPPQGGSPLAPGVLREHRRVKAEVLSSLGRASEAAPLWRELIRDEREVGQRRLTEQLQAQSAALSVQTLQRENDLLQARSRDTERALAAETRARWATTVVVVLLVAGALFALWWMTRVNRRIREVAARDALTGLLNRRSVLAAAPGGDARRRRDRPLAVVLIDVDHFKRVNDTYGHAAGDEVLRQVAARLRHGLRSDDLIARWGGEEFLLLLHGTGLDVAAALAERQRRLVADMPVALPQTAAPLAVTVSAGVSVVADGERGLEAALERADRALYRAKAAGRNAVVVLAPEPKGGGTPSSDGTSATSAPANAAEPV